MSAKREVRWYHKHLAKWFGVAVLRCPPENARRDFIKDFVMVFHYCRVCGAHRFDRHFDALSLSEHFLCGGCGTKRYTKKLCGISPFYLQECARIACSLSGGEGGKSKGHLLRLRMWKLAMTGLGRHMPYDRQGKTTGELEYEALFSYCLSLIIE